jgi:multiple sugar transport system ATP-binding protein
MAEVGLERVAKTYANGVLALHDVTLHAADGELLVLVGPSGCGKTTLLRLIAGLETLTRGHVRLDGRVIDRLAPHRRDVAMVFQRPALYPHLSVRDNLAFGLDLRRPWGERLRGWFRRNGTVDERDKRVREAAELLELTDVLERRPAELSGGQQQRVALGRALVRRPAVFLLDEPLSNLDARLRLEMRRQLHLLHRRLRVTMIYVTHDQDEAMSLGDRVAVLHRGALHQVDRPAILYEKPANRFVAGFLGWPPMNLLDGQVVETDGLLFLVGEGACLTLVGPRQAEWRRFNNKEVTLGIRPEHLRFGTDRDGDTRLAMEVRLIETMGPTCLVTLQRGGWTLTVRHERGTVPLEGTTVEVGFAFEQAHLFDRESGIALAQGRADLAACGLAGTNR